MAALEAGMQAPDFCLPSHTGESVCLSDLKGKKVVLFFYPKDDTPGCTTECTTFRDFKDQFIAAGAVIYGISRDSVASHTKFSTKYDLNMPLLSDENGEVCERYGVWKEKNMYGKKSFGIERTTFVLDEQGVITRVFPKVKVDGHVEQVLSVVREHQ